MRGFRLQASGFRYVGIFAAGLLLLVATATLKSAGESADAGARNASDPREHSCHG